MSEGSPPAPRFVQPSSLVDPRNQISDQVPRGFLNPVSPPLISKHTLSTTDLSANLGKFPSNSLSSA
jgi:hypothetical protein